MKTVKESICFFSRLVQYGTVGFVFLSSIACAENVKNLNAKTSSVNSPVAKYRSQLQLGKQFSVNYINYRMVNNVVATAGKAPPPASTNNNARTLSNSANSVSNANDSSEVNHPIDQKGDIRFYFTDPINQSVGRQVDQSKNQQLTEKSASTLGALSSNGSNNTQPASASQGNQSQQVVWNEQQQRFGILSGNIVLRLSNEVSQAVIADYRLRKITEIKSIGMVIVEVTKPDDIIIIYQKLQKDSRINKVSIEVIEHIATAK